MRLCSLFAVAVVAALPLSQSELQIPSLRSRRELVSASGLADHINNAAAQAIAATPGKDELESLETTEKQLEQETENAILKATKSLPETKGEESGEEGGSPELGASLEGKGEEGEEGDEGGEGDEGDEEEEEDEEEDEEEESIFKMGNDMPGPYVCQHMIVLIVVTVIFEKVTHAFKVALKPYPHYSEMLSHVFTELTILGFISFTITILIQAGAIPEGESFEAFEYAHVAIFFVAMIYTIQAATIAGLTVPIKKMWRACDEQDLEEFKQDLEYHRTRQHEKKQVKYWLLWVRQYHQLRCTFLQKNPDLPSNFKFALYLEQMLNHQAVEMMEITDLSWFLTVVAFGCVWLALKFGSTCCTLKTTLILGYIIFVLNIVLFWYSQYEIDKLLNDSCPVVLDGQGFIHEPCLNKWWINKWDSAAKASALAELAEKEEKGSENGKEDEKKGLVEDTESSSSFHPMYFKFFLDVMQLFNCFYMAWYFSQMVFLAAGEHEWGYFIFIPLPSLIMQFCISPLLFMNFSILLAVGDEREAEVYEEVVSYMEKEEELVGQVRDKLRDVPDLIENIYLKFDDDNSGSLSCTEFKAALAGFGIHFGYHDFIKVMRVVDPDQSDEIGKDELEEFLESGQVMENAVRRVLADVDLEQMFIDFKQSSGNMPPDGEELALDQMEFKRALSLKGIHYNHEDYLKFWKVVDADNSGRIDLGELRSWRDGGESQAQSTGFRLSTPIPTSHEL